MKKFQERQFLNRWWLLMLILACIVIIVGTAYYATIDAPEDTALIVSVISIAITLPIVLGLLYLRLETSIDQDGVTAWFKPFSFTKKHFDWGQISECYVRKYSSREFGGWGLRGLGREWKAYFIYGEKGIQLVTNQNKKFFIGTQRPAAAKNSIKHYFQNSPDPNHEK
jgi:hypothetical protein